MKPAGVPMPLPNPTAMGVLNSMAEIGAEPVTVRNSTPKRPTACLRSLGTSSRCEISRLSTMPVFDTLTAPSPPAPVCSRMSDMHSLLSGPASCSAPGELGTTGEVAAGSPDSRPGGGNCGSGRGREQLVRPGPYSSRLTALARFAVRPMTAVMSPPRHAARGGMFPWGTAYAEIAGILRGAIDILLSPAGPRP